MPATLDLKDYLISDVAGTFAFQDLFAAILAKGIAQQLKQGLYREYITEWDNLSVMRAKLDIHGTITNKVHRKSKLSCEYDELPENNVFNQILKTTATILLRQSTVNAERRTALKKVMIFFGGVDMIEPTCIKWNMLRYQRNNQSYKMLLYAKTEETITLDCDFMMKGNKISVKTLDLNIAFNNIAEQLNKIAESYFGEVIIKEA